MLKKFFYRAFQCTFSCSQVFIPQRAPELLTGPGSVKKLPQFIKDKGLKNVLIVTDGVLPKLGLLNGLFDACKEFGLKYTLYDGAQVNPPFECIEEAYSIYIENKCEGFIAFGGGSAMDCAKAAASRVSRPNCSLKQLAGTLRVRHKLPPLFAVPTTAGTGSEATIAAVITDSSNHHKLAIQDPCILPRYAVLDPELTLGLPQHITSTTGMDAMTHAVEAYINKYGPQYTKRLSESAVKLIYENLKKAYDDGSNVEARNNMLLASYEAGRAFSRSCVGYVHAIAHTLGGLYGTPHGLANAVILPHVLRAFGESVYKPLSKLADQINIKGNNNKEKAIKFIEYIEELNKSMNIPAGFDFIKDADIEQMVTWALKEANPIYPVPEIWDRDKITSVIHGIIIPKQK